LGVLQEIELGTEVRKLGNHLCSGKLPFRFLAPSVWGLYSAGEIESL